MRDHEVKLSLPVKKRAKPSFKGWIVATFTRPTTGRLYVVVENNDEMRIFLPQSLEIDYD